MVGNTLTISYAIGGSAATDGNAYARVDQITGTLQVMDYEHHEIHAGRFITRRHPR
jgi:hypothetical protein